MTFNRVLFVAVATSLALSVATARADGFQLSDLNPFHSQKKNSRDSRQAASESRGTILPRMPKLEMPTMGSAPRRPNQPTTWQKMQRNTSQAFSSMTSWTRPSPKSKPRSQPAKKKSSAFSWLFPQPEPKPPIRDVNDFLSLPRPEFDQ
ncbi:MAG: hypothetical protein J5I93_04385 [Pirellulaceae bacterium]|nr:hypothetical protein [Pirellulaceae bacterium]